MKHFEYDSVFTAPGNPEIQPPITVPDNPPAPPPEIKPGHDPDPSVYPPEVNPMEPYPEISPEKK